MHSLHETVLLCWFLFTCAVQCSCQMKDKSGCSPIKEMSLVEVLEEIEIKKPANDKSDYLGLVLSNNMKVILASDPECDKAAAALSVGVGFLSDPWEVPGLAHFCEHMLFLGTEKYPQENDYIKYLSENGGVANAFTSDDQTTYHFEVAPSALKGALDRFSGFFQCPLFTESATAREIKAVDSENDKNLQADGWRIFQLRRSTMDQTHDYAKFCTGNAETLDKTPKAMGLNVREELLKFHSKYYSSNIMTLAVAGKESLDTLKDYVLELFSSIHDKAVKRPEWWGNHPMRPENAGQIFYVVPIEDIHKLTLHFATIDPRDYYKAAPFSYLSRLLSLKGPGSLSAELKARGWITKLAAEQTVTPVGFGIFGVEFEMPEEGTEHVNDIIKLFFQYVEMVTREGAQKWIFDEEGNLKKIEFLFRDKEPPTEAVVKLVAALHTYPVEDAIYGPYSRDVFDPVLIEECMALVNPDNMRVEVVSSKFEDKADKTERWYGTRYGQETICANLLDEWKNCGLNPAFKMPEKNEFIPTDFSIQTTESEQSAVVPEMIADSGMSQLWYKADNKFKMPKADLMWSIDSPYSYTDPLSAVLTQLFARVFRDELNELTYNAEIAGLQYSLDPTYTGLSLQIFGYNHKQRVLLDKVLDKMADFRPEPARFAVIKETFKRNLQNFKAEQPVEHAFYYSSVATSDTYWTKDELLGVLDGVTVEQVTSFLSKLLSRISIEALMYGNVSKSTAIELNSHLEERLVQAFGSLPMPSSQRKYIRDIELPKNCFLVYAQQNTIHSNNAVAIYYQMGPENTKNNVLLELLQQVMAASIHDELRTKQQLGYIVECHTNRDHGCQGLHVIIQSDRDCFTLEDKCAEFFTNFRKTLEEMPEEVFKKYVEGLATRRLEKSKRISEESNKLWNEIVSRWYHFNRDEVDVEALRKVKKSELIDFFKQYVHPESDVDNNVRKLSIHVVSTLEDKRALEKHFEKGVCFDEDRVPSKASKAVFITDLAEFKESCALYPLPKPIIRRKKAARL